MTNKSGIEPTGYCVLVKQHKAPRLSKGGLELPDQYLEREDGGMTRGEIVAMSPLAFNYAEWPEGRHPKVGDLIHFKRYSWAQVQGADRADYWLVEDKSIQAVLDAKAFGFKTEEANIDAAA